MIEIAGYEQDLEDRNASRISLDEQKERLITNPATGLPDYLRLQARCVRAFGPAVGIFLRQAVYWTGKSTKLEGAWFYKSRERWRKETGLSNRQQEKARKVLKDQSILTEKRVSRRSPLHFKVDLEYLEFVLEARE